MLSIGLVCLTLFFACWLLLSLPQTTLWDQSVSAFAYRQRRPWLNTIMLFFTELGKPLGICLVFAPQLFLPAVRLQLALPGGISITISWWLAYVLKRLIKRPRPLGQRLVEESDHSFPSFHATSSAAMYLSFAIGGSQLWPQLGWFWYSFPILIFLLIGISRIYLGVHYLSDILGGWFLGAAAAFLTAFFLQ